MSSPLAELEASLVGALRRALDSLDPARLVEGALDSLDPARLVEGALDSLDPARLVAHFVDGALGSPSSRRRGRTRVIAVGKAALAMTQGAMARWGDAIEDALVVTVDPLAASPAVPPMTILGAAHPVPDERSVEAAIEALTRASSLGEEDLLLALVSGGASSLLSYPPRGMSLADKQAIVAVLLERGAAIREINVVRRHMSQVKGGRLALRAAPAHVLSLIMSDVIDGAPWDVGSGPTVADPSTVRDAREILERYELADQAARWLEESLKPGELDARLEQRILADPSSLAHAMATELRREGFNVEIEGPEEGEARAIVERRVTRAATLQPGDAVIIACEPTLALPVRHGHGGRSGFIALAAMRALPEDTVLLCAASDGVDGSSGGAGAMVSRERARALSDATIEEALERFDDASIHRALGTQLAGGPSGHNLADLHVLARPRSN